MNYKRLASWLQFTLFDCYSGGDGRKAKKWIKKQISKRTRREYKRTDNTDEKF